MLQMDSSCVAIQRNKDRLEKWTENCLMELNKWKCKVLPLRRDNPRQKRKTSWKAASQRRTLVFWQAQVENEPEMQPHSKEGLQHSITLGKALPAGQKGDFSSLLIPCGTHLKCRVQF